MKRSTFVLTGREKGIVAFTVAVFVLAFLLVRAIWPTPASAFASDEEIDGPVRVNDAAGDLRLAQEAAAAVVSAPTSTRATSVSPSPNTGSPVDVVSAGLPAIPRALPMGFIPRMTVTIGQPAGNGAAGGASGTVAAPTTSPIDSSSEVDLAPPVTTERPAPSASSPQR